MRALTNHLFKKMKEQRGAAMVEYGLLVAGVALISMASVSHMGMKTEELFSATAALLPGAHTDDNAPMLSGKLIETTPNADGNIALDGAGILANSNGTVERLGENLGVDNISALVVEA